MHPDDLALLGRSLGKAVRKALISRDDRIATLEAEVKDLRTGSASAPQIADLAVKVAELTARYDALQLKDEELQRQCSGHKRHLQGLESRIAKATNPPLKTFDSSKENL